MVKTKKGKIRLRRWVWIVFIICSGVGLLISEVIIFKWRDDSKQIEEQIDKINDKLDIKVTKNKDSENDEMINPPDNKNSDYWSFIEMPMISVNFNELIEKNSDTVAFVKVNGTKINYPVVQTSDNDYYLGHAFDKSSNNAGWVFMDYRNDIDNLQDNTIIYAHGRIDTTMFGSLKNVLSNNWYKNVENRVIYMSSMNENTMWQIFSVYVIPTETYYLTSSFGSEESKSNFINTIVSRSVHQFNTDVNVGDKLLTLSTCYNEKEKLVLHAKLIKKQTR